LFDVANLVKIEDSDDVKTEDSDDVETEDSDNVETLVETHKGILFERMLDESDLATSASMQFTGSLDSVVD
jgi:hypothetical protein